MNLRIGITGAHGYVGARLCATLASAGHEVVRLVRLPHEGERYFCLGEIIAPETLEDLDVLVHCAWDMRAAGPSAVRRTNIRGSVHLFDAAHTAGVSRVIFISSMSAFPGCHSQYGLAKLEVEQAISKRGGISIRPGLVYGPEPGGMVGALLRLASVSPVLPMIGRGRYPLFPCHEDDLSELLLVACMSAQEKLQPVITAAERKAWPFRDIVTTLAGRKLFYIPVPWQLAWAGLRLLELFTIRSRLKSDSLLGLVYSNQEPDFAALDQLGAAFRPLAAPGSRGK